EVNYVATTDNIGYGRACNLGAQLGSSPVIGFFNADTRFINNQCISVCADYLIDHNDVAVVGPYQTDDNGKVTAAGIFGTPTNPQDRAFGKAHSNDYTDIAEAVTVSGSAYFTKRSAWD